MSSNINDYIWRLPISVQIPRGVPARKNSTSNVGSCCCFIHRWGQKALRGAQADCRTKWHSWWLDYFVAQSVWLEWACYFRDIRAWLRKFFWSDWDSSSQLSAAVLHNLIFAGSDAFRCIDNFASAPLSSVPCWILNPSILKSANYLKSLTNVLLIIIGDSNVVILVQGVFQVSAAQPVNYVIEEMEDLFNLDNEVGTPLNLASFNKASFNKAVICLRFWNWEDT